MMLRSGLAALCLLSASGLAQAQQVTPEISVSTILSEALTAAPPQYDDNLRHATGLWPEELRLRLLEGPHMLSRDAETGVVTPAANSDPRTIREIIDLLLYASEKRSSKNILMAGIEDRMTGPGLFHAHGLITGPDRNPVLWEIMTAVDKEVSWFALRDKDRFARPRPAEIDPALQPALPVQTSAYPGMMASRAWAIADLLSRLNPVCAPWYETTARNAADNRQVAGLNLASDNTAGRVLAARIVEQMISGGHLAEAGERLKAELRSGANPFTPCHLMK